MKCRKAALTKTGQPAKFLNKLWQLRPHFDNSKRTTGMAKIITVINAVFKFSAEMFRLARKVTGCSQDCGYFCNFPGLKIDRPKSQPAFGTAYLNSEKRW
jgi:hypothetical protein